LSVEVSATDWSLVQRSPTDCGASCVWSRKPREWGGHSPCWAAAPCEKKNLRQSALFLAVSYLPHFAVNLQTLNTRKYAYYTSVKIDTSFCLKYIRSHINGQLHSRRHIISVYHNYWFLWCSLISDDWVGERGLVIQNQQFKVISKQCSCKNTYHLKTRFAPPAETSCTSNISQTSIVLI
jgi:hypothetical protein